MLNHATVSRYHARLVQIVGGWHREDRGSFNGTAVNHVYNRIKEATLGPDDSIYFRTFRVPVRTLLSGQKTQGVTLAHGPITLGRDHSQLVPDPWVAKAAVTLRRRGNHIVLDAAAVRGVFLNNEAVKSQVVLRLGDQLYVGTTCFRVHSEGEIEQWNYRERLSIEAREVGVEVNGQWLIRRISLALFPRELVALMGPSGAGKTTLKMCLCGYLRPSEGNVLFNGERLYDNYMRFSPFLGYVPQEDIMHRELTVREALYFSARLRLPKDYSEKEIDERVHKVIATLGLEDCENVVIGSPERKGISGGQRKRVHVAMELLTKPLILFLDEPISGLSSEDALLVIQLLRQLADEGRIVVVTVHQPRLNILRLFDHLILVAKDRKGAEAGELVYFGPAHPDAAQFFKPGKCASPHSEVESWPDEILRGLAHQPVRYWTYV